MPRWAWIALLASLVTMMILLALADSTLLQGLFPRPLEPRVRPLPFRPPLAAPGAVFVKGRIVNGFDLGRAGGLFTFWWFMSVGAGLLLLTLGVLVAVPQRARRAAERVSLAALPLLLAAGVATLLLGAALSVLLEVSGFVLLWFGAVLWALGALGILFGLAALALATGRWLRGRLGPVPPLVAAAAAVLVLINVGLVPVLGWIALFFVGVTSLGLSVLTRLGLPGGWNLEELNF